MQRLGFLLVVLTLPIETQKKTDLNILGTEKDTLQKKYSLNRLDVQCEKRKNDFEEIVKSKKAFNKSKKKMLSWYKDIIGKLLAKNNFNIVVTLTADFESFSVEWVAFVSLPNQHVTRMFYVPQKFNPPYPAVYIPCGHSFKGKANKTYQKASRLFGMNGYVVIQADPICQGERFQYLDENDEPITGKATHMHEILGQHLMLTGSSSLIHELWDNIRCLDFLEQNLVVDINKLARERILKSDKKRESFLIGKSRKEIVNRVKEIIGFTEPDLKLRTELVETISEEGYKINKYLLLRDYKYNFSLPALLFIPNQKSVKSQATIIIGDYGTKDQLRENQKVKSELKKGNVVLVFDVCHSGELKDSGEPHYDNIEFWIAKLPLYEGKTLVVCIAEDILIANRYLKNLGEYNISKINLISIGLTGFATLHAAYLDGNFNEVELGIITKKCG